MVAAWSSDGDCVELGSTIQLCSTMTTQAESPNLYKEATGRRCWVIYQQVEGGEQICVR